MVENEPVDVFFLLHKKVVLIEKIRMVVSILAINIFINRNLFSIKIIVVVQNTNLVKNFKEIEEVEVLKKV